VGKSLFPLFRPFVFAVFVDVSVALLCNDDDDDDDANDDGTAFVATLCDA